MRLKVPNGSELYVFGSFLSTESPNDIDILIRFDPSIQSTENIYIRHQSLVKQIEEIVNCKVDITFLSLAEEKEIGFIEESGAITWLELMTSHNHNALV